MNRNLSRVEIKQEFPVRLVLVWLLGSLGILSPFCAVTSCVRGKGMSLGDHILSFPVKQTLVLVVQLVSVLLRQKPARPYLHSLQVSDSTENTQMR